MIETYEAQLCDCLSNFLAMAEDGIRSSKNVTYNSQFSIHDWEKICREARNLLNLERAQARMNKLRQAADELPRDERALYDSLHDAVISAFETDDLQYEQVIRIFELKLKMLRQESEIKTLSS